MDFGGIFTRSWQVTWKYRALWLYGVLFALFGGGQGSQFNPGNLGNLAGGGGGGRGGSGGGNVVPTTPEFNWQAIAIIIGAIICIALIWFLLSILLRFVSRGALVGLVDELETNQTVPTVRQGWNIGSDRFVSLLGIGLVVNIPLTLLSLLLLLIAALPILASVVPLIGTPRGRAPDQLLGLAAAGVLSSIFLICCVVLLLVIVALIVRPFYEFFVRVCVVNRRGAIDSIREGYRMVRANLGNVTVLYIIIIGIGIGFGIIMIPVTLLLFGIPVAAGFAVGALANSVTEGILVGVLIGIPMLLILLLISGVYQAFEQTVWTEGFLALARPTAAPVPAPTPPQGPAPTAADTSPREKIGPDVQI